MAAIAVLALAGATGLLAGCGGSSTSASSTGPSSKPAYCSDVTNFKNAAARLPGVSNPSALVSDINNVVSAGKTAVSAVETSFAREANAVKSSLTMLETLVKQLSSSSTRASALTQIPGAVTAVVTAADSFATATKSKCS
jgi:hypothetical protein